jgi:cell division protein FtsZ
MQNNELSVPKVTVLGVGGAGCRIIRTIAGIPGSGWLNLCAADTDEVSLNNSGIENTLAAGTEWNGGAGCGGNPDRASRAFSSGISKELESLISGSSMLIITGGLGMGTATGGTPVLARIAKRLKIPVICLMTLPFVFEGQSKNEIAENGLTSLLSDADIVIPLPNDLLFSTVNAEIPVKEAFRKSDEAIAHAVIGLTEILRCRELVNIGFAELKELIGGKKTQCCLAMGFASDENAADRPSSALSTLLESPLINGAESFQDADAVITTVIGGDELSIGELKETLEAVNKLTASAAHVTSGVSTDEKYNGKLFITSLLITYEKKEEIPEARKKKTQSRPWRAVPAPVGSNELVQPELFQKNTTKGYFQTTEVNIVNGVDLDIPTFQRKDVSINLGF